MPSPSRFLRPTLAAGLASLALAASAQTPDPPAEALLADLAFEKGAPAHRIVIDIAPAGNAKRLPLLLDTGATDTVLTPRIAKELGVSVRAAKSTPYRRRTALGRDLQFWIDTRRSDTAATGSGVEHALLGGAFLSKYVVEFDFREKRVRFYDPDRFEVPESSDAPDTAVLPLELVSNRPAIEAKVNGRPLVLLIDTGAPPPLLLSGEIAASSGVSSKPLRGYAVASVAGPIETELGVARLDVGPFAFPGVSTTVAVHGFMNYGFPGDSLVGIDLLKQFLVRIDYPRRRLFLRRDPQATFAFDAEDPGTIVTAATASDMLPPEPADAREAIAPRDDGVGQQVWLEWAAPAEGERVEGPVGWVEVRGWAGVGDPVRHDVVIAIDISGSTIVASGVDVDSDGKVGKQRRRHDSFRSFNPRHYSSDLDDTVFNAELVATRRLVELLDPDRTRIGIVVFAARANILAPLGSGGERIEDVLRDLDAAWGAGMTNLAEAIERAHEVLITGERFGDPRRQSILVLSDGWPTVPDDPDRAAEAAYRAAVDAADHGVRIHTFGLGLEPVADEQVYAAVAKVSGGQYRRLAQPGEIIHELPRVDLADVAEIEIANLSNGSAGRAVRVRPDGSFDGFLMLANGENRVRVTARSKAGRERSDERTVQFDEREPRDPQEAAAFEKRVGQLRTALEHRRLETELANEIDAVRARQRRELVIDLDERDAEPETQGGGR